MFIGINTINSLIENNGENCLAKLIEPGHLKRFLGKEYLCNESMAVIEHIICSIYDNQYDEVVSIIFLARYIHPGFYVQLARELISLVSPESPCLVIRTLNFVIKLFGVEIPIELSREIFGKYMQVVFTESKPKEPNVNISYRQSIPTAGEETDRITEDVLCGIRLLEKSVGNLLTRDHLCNLLDSIKAPDLIYYRGTFIWLTKKLIKKPNTNSILGCEIKERNLINFLMADALNFISESHARMKELGLETCRSSTTLCGRASFSIELQSRFKFILLCAGKCFDPFDFTMGDNFMKFYMRISSIEWGYPKNIFFSCLNKALNSESYNLSFIDLSKIIKYEEEWVSKTLQPTHFSSHVDAFDFFLYAFDGKSFCALFQESARRNLFWDVMSNTREKSLVEKAMEIVEGRYKCVDDTTKEVHATLKKYAGLYPKESDERKELIRTKVRNLLTFYTHFITKMRKSVSTSFELSDDRFTTRLDVTFCDSTKTFTFPSKVNTNEFIKEVSTSFFGADNVLLHNLYKKDKMKLYALSVSGEESEFIPAKVLDLQDITDILIIIPEDKIDLCTKEIREKDDTLDSGIEAKSNLGMKGLWDTQNDIEDIFKEDDFDMDLYNNENVTTLSFASFLIHLLNTNLFKIGDEEDFAMVDLIFGLLDALPRVSCSADTFTSVIGKDTMKSVLFKESYNKICAGTYILGNAHVFKNGDRTILDELFDKDDISEDLSGLVVSSMEYLCTGFLSKPENNNKTYYRAIITMIEVVLPLFTFTEEENDTLLHNIRLLLENKDLSLYAKAEIAYAAVKMVCSQKGRDLETVHLLGKAVLDGDYILLGFTSVSKHTRGTMRDFIRALLVEMAKRNDTSFHAVSDKLFSQIEPIVNNCGKKEDAGEYFNLLNDIFAELESRFTARFSNDVLQRVANLITGKKMLSSPVRNVLLKLFFTVAGRHPWSPGKLHSKEVLTQTLCMCNSFNPVVTRTIRLLISNCEEFKDLFSSFMRNYILEHLLEPQCCGSYMYGSSLELSLFHVLSNIPAFERAILDVNTSGHKEGFLRKLQSMVMWFKYGSDKADKNITYDFLDVLLELKKQQKESDSPLNIVACISDMILKLPRGKVVMDSLTFNVALNFALDEKMPGNKVDMLGFSVPPSKTVLESLKQVANACFCDDIFEKDIKLDIKKMPYTLLVHCEASDNIPGFKNSISIREIMSTPVNMELPKSCYNYTLSGLVSYSKVGHRIEFSSFVRVGEKWFDINKNKIAPEKLHDPSRRLYLLVYTRPFVSTIDSYMLYDSRETAMMVDDSGLVSVKLLNTSGNVPLLNQVRNATDFRPFERKYTAERIHFIFQMADISGSPENIVKYILQATYMNDEQTNAVIANNLGFLARKVECSQEWKKAFVYSLLGGYIFQFWVTCMDKNLLDNISDLCTFSVVSEVRQDPKMSDEITNRLVSFYMENDSCHYCLKLLHGIEEGTPNKQVLCNSLIFDILSVPLKADRNSQNKEIVSEAAIVLAHSICYVLTPKVRLSKGFNSPESPFTKSELNRLLACDNLLKTVLDNCRMQDGEDVARCISLYDTEMLVPMADVLLDFLGSSKSIEEDTRAFSYINAFLEAEDEHTQMRRRLVVSPHLLSHPGVLAVHRRSREMSLGRLVLYIDFLMGLGPDKTDFLANWRQDIEKFEDLLANKLEILIDKNIVYDRFAESESKYGIPKNRSKYWTGKNVSAKILSESDSDLLERAIRFKNAISNHVLLKAENPNKATKVVEENAYMREILAANTVCSASVESEFSSTTEGVIAIYDMLVQSQKEQTGSTTATTTTTPSPQSSACTNINGNGNTTYSYVNKKYKYDDDNNNGYIDILDSDYD